MREIERERERKRGREGEREIEREGEKENGARVCHFPNPLYLIQYNIYFFVYKVT